MPIGRGNYSAPLSPAAQALGLGGDLQQQLQEEELKKKKKLLQQGQALASGALSPATAALFPAMGTGM